MAEHLAEYWAVHLADMWVDRWVVQKAEPKADLLVALSDVMRAGLSAAR